MIVGELLLSAFFEALFDRLVSRDLLNFVRQLQGGLFPELKKWEKKLRMIQAFLSDAEEKQLTDAAVKMWLEDLRDLAYDAEDILDEFATEALERKLNMAESDDHQATTNKVKNIVPAACFNCFNPTTIKFNVSMRSKIKDITSHLEELCKQRIELGLQLSTLGGTSSAAARRRSPSSSVPTESTVYGRDEDKANILKLVLSNETSDTNFRVIPIVGMAGIGKTTLAREVYNDNAVNVFKFDVKAWVCVSDDFDVLSSSKALLESITSAACDLKSLNEVQVQLRKTVDGKKALLVLDDVWNEDYCSWEELKAPFLTAAPNSKIIVTTRHSRVASIMGLTEHYNLRHLSDEDCRSLFVKHAFEGSDSNAHKISEFRNKVVRKCGGLPLAAKALGGLLRSNRDDAWDDILNSNMMNFPRQNGILSVLQLSYHYLPSHLKRCFAYCAIFPKDYEFRKKEIVLLWMAEGIIQQPRNDKRLENWGNECFDELVSRSIFQQSNNDIFKFVMHDLVHDLAQLISGETIFRLEDAKKLSRRFERVRHSSYTRDWWDGKIKFETFYKVEYLRTFLPILRRGDTDTSYISYIVLRDLLPKFKKLRVLSLQGYHITQLPFSFKDLSLLRYLNLAGTWIRNLPKSTSSLLNLQILILRNCFRLIKLPSNMRNLINLHHLDIEGANSLKEMPLGIKELKNLQTLSNFIVGKCGTVSTLKDLKNLKFLHGELCISGLENLNGSQDAREALLCDKQNLEALSLQWGSQFDNSRDEAVEENVLDMMQPHKNIKRLAIKCYGGARFPFWLGDGSFSVLKVLTLENCGNCKSLPSLGLLGSLKHLTIEGLAKLKRINSEICGKGCSKLFQALETLRFENLQEWEYWDTIIEENDHVEVFPCLRELSIMRCPKLSGKLPKLLPSLETLVVRNCAELVVPISSFPMLCKLEIDECKGMLCCSTLIDSKSIKCMTILNSSLEIYGCKGMLYNGPTEFLKYVTISNMFEFGKFLKQGFQVVETLAIGDPEQVKLWNEYKAFEFGINRGIHILSYLEEISIEENCISLVSFPDVNFLPNNLRSLKIKNNRALKSLPEEMMGNNSQLERLHVRECDSLTFIARCKIPSSLKRLEISFCQNLQHLVVFEVDAAAAAASSLFSSMTLKHLEISNCHNLTTLSSRIQLFEALEYLDISNCPKLESLPDGLHNLNCLYHISVRNCPSFVSFPERGLPTTTSSLVINRSKSLKALPDNMHKLNSLRDLTIRECPSIVSFPEAGFPTSLTSLRIEDVKIYKALTRWGFHRLSSLRSLWIYECHDGEYFPDEEMGMNFMLPTSLTHLKFSGFQKLIYLSSVGISLEHLWIENCPKLKSFPELGLPSSLMRLFIDNCPLLRENCRRDKGKEWSKIAHIPCVMIDYKFIYDVEDEE